MSEVKDDVEMLLEKLDTVLEGVEYDVVVSTCLSIVANLCTDDSDADSQQDKDEMKALRASTGLALINLAGYLHHLNNQDSSQIILPH